MSNNITQRLVVTSSAFKDGEMIPFKYTLNGENVSPDISWKGAPDDSKSFVIIATDHDIPISKFRLFTWNHWVVYNIPPDVLSLPEAVSATENLDNGAKQGMNSFRKTGYGGPCPPFGTHRYYFKVYAVDIKIDLEPKDAVKKKVLKAIGDNLREDLIIAYIFPMPRL